MGRDGLLRLLDHARKKSFDVVIVETLDRLSRACKILQVPISAYLFSASRSARSKGIVNIVLIGLSGLVGQLYREGNGVFSHSHVRLGCFNFDNYPPGAYAIWARRCSSIALLA